MALRTIEAPFVEIKEYDKSSYTTTMTGSAALIMGFANQGEDYVTNRITSKSSWKQTFGNPTNEAERYFYTASMEVIDQGGNLYCAKIPYDNTSTNVYRAVELEVHTPETMTELSSIPQLSDESISEISVIGGSDMSRDVLDSYLNGGESKVAEGKIVIVDKNKTNLSKVDGKECIGLVPVVTTPVNALYFQRFIDAQKNIFNPISTFKTKGGVEVTDIESTDKIASDNYEFSISKEAVSYFKTIGTDLNGKFTKNVMNKIGVVVFQMYVDTYNDNRIGFTPVESFMGGFDKEDIDHITNSSTFIDDIINSNSDYIYFFSNITGDSMNATKFLSNQQFKILGFDSTEITKDISLSVMNEALDVIFEQNKDIINKDIDIVCDAGITNIGQYVKSVKSDKGLYDPEINQWTLNSKSDLDTWMALTQKIDNFCHKERGDCMFIHDGPRNLVIEGKNKIVRTTKPTNTIDKNILPKIKYITGFETSYTAGYMNWVKVADPITSESFWCPPSIAAMGVYINCDLNANYWDAPAGLNRGKISVLDLSFNPSIPQAGQIYQKGWNYAINWSDVGPTIEGQHTLQIQPTAFDRVNVRRLFLRLERQSFKVARYFVYEGNTTYTRQRLIDALDPMFKSVKTNGGIYDYKIICDETINTAEVIDNNELRVKIGIKPVKTAEFVIVDFYALPTGGSFSEM